MYEYEDKYVYVHTKISKDHLDDLLKTCIYLSNSIIPDAADRVVLNFSTFSSYIFHKSNTGGDVVNVDMEGVCSLLSN